MTYLQTPSRRAMLAGLAFSAAAPVSAETLVETTSETSPDAELLALGRQWQEHAAEYDRVDALRWEADERYKRPEVPEAMFLGPDDFSHFYGFNGTHHFSGRRWYGDRESMSEVALTCLSTSRPETRARCEEIVVAYNWWTAEQKRRKEACGLLQAEAETDRLDEENRALRNQIARTRARTLAGMLVKARMVIWCHAGGQDFIDGVDETLTNGVASDEHLALSAACDLIAMVMEGGADV